MHSAIPTTPNKPAFGCNCRNQTRRSSGCEIITDFCRLARNDATDPSEIGGRSAQIVTKFGIPTLPIPVEAFVPTLEESLWIDPLLCGFLLEDMPRGVEVGTAPLIEQVPEVIHIPALATLDNATELLGTGLVQGVATNLSARR